MTKIKKGEGGLLGEFPAVLFLVSASVFFEFPSLKLPNVEFPNEFPKAEFPNAVLLPLGFPKPVPKFEIPTVSVALPKADTGDIVPKEIEFPSEGIALFPPNVEFPADFDS